jgi:hypothetical protein
MKIFIATIIVFFVILTFSAYADMIIIPDDYPTIQQGIGAAANGDTVIAYPDTYPEHIDFLNKNIVVCSRFLTTGDTLYVGSTIIDGGNSGIVVTIDGSQDSTAELVGFTIQNGSASRGGGIYLTSSFPQIRDNLITGNHAGWDLNGWLEESPMESIPSKFGLLDNYPNPFNATTTIRYALLSKTDIRIDIFNLRGQLVETLFNENQPAGEHCIMWNVSSYASGVYFCRLSTGERIFTKRITLLK